MVMPRGCTEARQSSASMEQPAACSVTLVRNGPRKTVMTVVENAELAQSERYQPVRSRLPAVAGVGVPVTAIVCAPGCGSVRAHDVIRGSLRRDAGHCCPGVHQRARAATAGSSEAARAVHG